MNCLKRIKFFVVILYLLENVLKRQRRHIHTSVIEMAIRLFPPKYTQLLFQPLIRVYAPFIVNSMNVWRSRSNWKSTRFSMNTLQSVTTAKYSVNILLVILEFQVRNRFWWCCCCCYFSLRQLSSFLFFSLYSNFIFYFVYGEIFAVYLPLSTQHIIDKIIIMIIPTIGGNYAVVKNTKAK